jgi:hypothetical protein
VLPALPHVLPVPVGLGDLSAPEGAGLGFLLGFALYGLLALIRGARARIGRKLGPFDPPDPP